MSNYTYQFNRQEDVAPTGGIVAEDISTTLRGEDPTLDQVLSGLSSFVPACGFNLNGSGIGVVASE